MVAAPSSRKTLIDYCLRKLGAPVIEINVDYDQIEDCVNDAIQFYQEFHTDATKRLYISHQITASDVTNKYITIDPDVITVARLLPIGSSSLGAGAGMFSIKYQLHLNDIANMNSFMGDLSYYSQIGQWLETLDLILTGYPQVNFSRHEDRLYIHGEFYDQALVAGDWIVMEVYKVIDPTVATNIFNDIFIKNYTTALIKLRWGNAVSKFDGMQLPGGVTISGERIATEAKEEIKELEDKMRLEYEPMPDFFIG